MLHMLHPNCYLRSLLFAARQVQQCALWLNISDAIGLSPSALAGHSCKCQHQSQASDRRVLQLPDHISRPQFPSPNNRVCFVAYQLVDWCSKIKPVLEHSGNHMTAALLLLAAKGNDLETGLQVGRTFCWDWCMMRTSKTHSRNGAIMFSELLSVMCLSCYFIKTSLELSYFHAHTFLWLCIWCRGISLLFDQHDNDLLDYASHKCHSYINWETQRD